MDQETREVINRWHDMMSGSSHDGLLELLAEDCILVTGRTHTSARQRYHIPVSERGESGIRW